MFARSALLAALAGVASAQLSILAPGGPDLWWVAQSPNNVVWTCQQTQFSNFTILLTNSNVTVLNGALAIISNEPNADCSFTITTQKANLQPATRYTVQLANPINETDVYAQSQPFEVKALGAAYPATSATPTGTGTSSSGSGSASSTSSGASTTSSTSSSDAKGMGVSMGLVGAMVAGAAAFAL